LTGHDPLLAALTVARAGALGTHPRSLTLRAQPLQATLVGRLQPGNPEPCRR
jgi:hypothetical protein